jgi:transposase
MTIIYKAMYKSALAKKLGVSLPTLNDWIKDIPGLKISPKQRLLSPKQLETIIEHIGMPDQ